MSLFISFEGIDGSGKSPQARLLADRLRCLGRDVVLTREPGGSEGAEEIRKLLVEGDPGRWSSQTEILLFSAARRDHVERTIEPALQRNAVVLCDRFVDSTRAYQGGETDRALVDRIHQLMIGLMPSLTLIFDLDPAEGLARTDERAGTETRFEAKGLEFQVQLRSFYRALAASEPDRCRLIDAAHAPEILAEEVWKVAAEALELQ